MVRVASTRTKMARGVASWERSIGATRWHTCAVQSNSQKYWPRRSHACQDHSLKLCQNIKHTSKSQLHSAASRYWLSCHVLHARFMASDYLIFAHISLRPFAPHLPTSSSKFRLHLIRNILTSSFSSIINHHGGSAAQYVARVRSTRRSRHC